jgi:hypothetical protein
MGRQQQTVVVGSALVRRIVVVLAVAALMAAMMAAMAAPAFARAASVSPCSELEAGFKGNVVTGGNGETRFNCHAPGLPGR